MIRRQILYVILGMGTEPTAPWRFSMVTVLRAWIRRFGRREIDVALQEAQRKEAESAVCQRPENN